MTDKREPHGEAADYSYDMAEIKNDIVESLREVRLAANAFVVYGAGALRASDIVDEEGEPSIDVRVQRFDGSWFFHSGDEQYDTDHRGLWGRSRVVADLSDYDADLESIATDLLAQVADRQCGHSWPNCAFALELGR